jgi:hypothetical protein
MDILAIVLYGTIVFNLAVVIGLMLFVRRSWRIRSEEQKKRQARMVEQGKVISIQQDIIDQKDQLIDKYKEILKF